MIEIQSHLDICNLWAKTTDMADDMAVGRSCAAMWKMRQCIPPFYWKRLIAMAHTRFNVRLTADMLLELSRRPRPKMSKVA